MLVERNARGGSPGYLQIKSRNTNSVFKIKLVSTFDFKMMPSMQPMQFNTSTNPQVPPMNSAYYGIIIELRFKSR